MNELEKIVQKEGDLCRHEGGSFAEEWFRYTSRCMHEEGDAYLVWYI